MKASASAGPQEPASYCGRRAGLLAQWSSTGCSEPPRLLDPVAARVERGVAVDGVEQQPLVGLGRLAAEDLVDT